MLERQSKKEVFIKHCHYNFMPLLTWMFCCRKEDTKKYQIKRQFVL